MRRSAIECIREMKPRFPPVIELLKLVHNYKMFQIVGEVGNGAMFDRCQTMLEFAFHLLPTHSVRFIESNFNGCNLNTFGQTKHSCSCSTFLYRICLQHGDDFRSKSYWLAPVILRIMKLTTRGKYSKIFSTGKTKEFLKKLVKLQRTRTIKMEYFIFSSKAPYSGKRWRNSTSGHILTMLLNPILIYGSR